MTNDNGQMASSGQMTKVDKRQMIKYKRQMTMDNRQTAKKMANDNKQMAITENDRWQKDKWQMIMVKRQFTNVNR